MGEVYLAQDTRLNRRVAIKVLPEAYASDPDRVARFHREAQAVAALNHTSIAAIYDLAEADGIKYLVLELIEGDTLADRLRRGPVPVEEALQIAQHILEALEAAHEKGICHRDLKPANIKLTADAGVKVLDFGLAKFLQGGTTAAKLTQSPTLSLAGTYPGVILGTAGYMSPEQAKGLEADQRSDIFSFGCILFEMLTGRQAFEGETASEILASVLKIDVDLTTLPPRLNPRLMEALRRCLEKNPKKRWHAAADVRNEIEAAMGRAIVAAEPQTATASTRPLWKRAASAAAFAIAGGLIAGYAAWTFKPAPPRAVTRFALPLPEGQAFTNAGRQVLALSPDGTNLVYVANNRLYLRSMSGLESRVIAGTEIAQGILNPVFSPDGQSLAFYSNADRTVKRLAVGGAPVTICPADAVFGMSWDDSGVVFGQSGKGILRVSPNGGVPEVIVAVGSEELAAGPQMLPGARSVLFSVRKLNEGWDKGQVVVQPLDGGSRRTLIDGAEGRYLPTGHLVYAVGGVVLAVPLDVEHLAINGAPVPMIEGVRRGAPISATGLAPSTAQFAHASDGSLVYLPGPAGLAGSTATTLALFDRKGGAVPLKLPPRSYRSPRVSPDGKYIAFDSEDEKEAVVWVYKLAGDTAIQRLTFAGRNRAPLWSPDGQWIAFQSDREGDLAIFRQRADGSGAAERLTKPAAGAGHTPHSWSPDGQHLIFSETGSTLWVLTLKDRSTASFGGVEGREAVFSPDGRWVAYQTRTESGTLSFVEPFPRTGAKYVVPLGGGHPFWSPKGNELIVNSRPMESTSVAVLVQPRFGFGQPAPFMRVGRSEPDPAIGRRNVDMMPDGQHLIGVLSAATTDDTPSSITVVLNWFDELRQRVPRP